MDELTPEAASARIDAIYLDKTHPLHSYDPVEAQRGADEILQLTRISLAERGSVVHETFGGTSAAETATPLSAGAPNTPPADPPVTTPETALAVAEEMGFDKAEMHRLIEREARLPSGNFSREQALHGFDPAARGELERLHKKALDRLPVSLQVHLERRGTAWAPGIFGRLAELGAELDQLDESISVEAQRDPTSARLRELVDRRHGRRHVVLI